jgi:hypothetical protein
MRTRIRSFGGFVPLVGGVVALFHCRVAPTSQLVALAGGLVALLAGVVALICQVIPLITVVIALLAGLIPLLPSGARAHLAVLACSADGSLERDGPPIGERSGTAWTLSAPRIGNLTWVDWSQLPRRMVPHGICSM